MAYIKIDQTGRITAASYDFHCGDGEIEIVIPDAIEIANIHDYVYIDGEFIYTPLPAPEPPVPEPTVWDELDAAYTAGYDSGYAEGVNSI